MFAQAQYLCTRLTYALNKEPYHLIIKLNVQKRSVLGFVFSRLIL